MRRLFSPVLLFLEGGCWLFVEKRAVDLAMVMSEIFVICRQCWCFVEKVLGFCRKQSIGRVVVVVE